MRNECDEGIEGVRERHCFHDDGEEIVCCWCGDVFARDDETAEHGEYRPIAPAEMLSALKQVVASAFPHPVDHPAMTAAWKVAQAVIKKADRL